MTYRIVLVECTEEFIERVQVANVVFRFVGGVRDARVLKETRENSVRRSVVMETYEILPAIDGFRFDRLKNADHGSASRRFDLLQ